MAGWIKMALGTEVDLSPGLIVLDGNPAAPPQRGTASPSWLMSNVVAKRLPISAAAEHLHSNYTGQPALAGTPS